MQQTDLFE
jgi:phage/conjugal plasmid C-4 type zinc finger TraR family protein